MFVYVSMATVLYVGVLWQQKKIGGAIELKDKSFDYGSEMRAETARLKTHANQHIWEQTYRRHRASDIGVQRCSASMGFTLKAQHMKINLLRPEQFLQ